MVTREKDGGSNSLFSCLLQFVVAKPCEGARVKVPKDMSPAEQDLHASSVTKIIP